MIITRMRMKNFFRYKDIQSIEFVSHDQKNVTVLKGENGHGKTTLLSAFSWCFYGDLESPLTTEKMFNKNARSELGESDISSVFVEIDFIENEVKNTIRREIEFKKRNGQMVKNSEEKMQVRSVDKYGNSRKVDNQRDFFNQIIPVKLKKFFFFDGEKIDRLAQNDGREVIKEAILNLLGLNVIENLKNDLAAVDLKLTKELNKYLKNDDKKLTVLIEKLTEDRNSCIAEIDNMKERLQKMEEEEQGHSEFLQKYNISKISSLEKEFVRIESDQKELETEINLLGKSYNKLLSTDAKGYLADRLFDRISEILDEKRTKGMLPSDIKATFINDLIDRKVCICGRELIECGKEMQLLKKMLETAGKSELDDAYTRMMSYINQNRETSNTYFEKIESLSIKESRKSEKIKNNKKRLNEIYNEISEFNIEEINERKDAKLFLKGMIRDLDRDIVRKTESLNEIEKNLESSNENLRKIKLDNIEAQTITAFKNKVILLKALNNEVNQNFKEEIRIDLDQRIKAIFKSISHKDYREPELTEDLFLKIVNNFNVNQEDEILSTGENQIASLSFIGALVSYSKDKSDSKLSSSFMGGDFPIVMDSPFGNLDGVHSAHVAEGIADLSSQVIIIVSDKQWSQEVSDNMFDRVGKMYEIKEGVDFEIENGEYSVIEEVKL